MSFRAGDSVGVYRIAGPIGHGGAGQVFKAEHTITGRIDAIKVLLTGQPDAPDQAERFLREIRIQASLGHPNIASVHTAFWAGDGLVMAMEFVEGESLKRILERGRLPVATALEYACQALSALAYAHAHQVIHRDITPANILVTARGRVKVTDFGLAKAPTDIRLTQSGAVLGSFYYMSPEQVRASPDLDPRADIYSLGAVLYEMVTGARLFSGDSAFEIMSAQVGQAPRPPVEIEPALPPRLSEIILKAVAKDPAERFPSAQEFRLALESVREMPASTAAPRRPVFAWAAAGIALLLPAAFLVRPAQRPPVKVQASASIAPAAAAPKVEAPPAEPPNPRAFHAGAAVWSVALSPSGRWLAAGLEDRGIEIWDTAAGKRQALLRGHAAGVGALCFSRDEKWLASGSADRTAKLWDFRAGAERSVFPQGAMVTAVALSPDGHWLAAASSDRRVKFWNLDADRKPEGFRSKSEPRALAFSTDSGLLAVGSEIGVKLWRVDARREVQSLDRPAAAVAFAPDGRCLTLDAAAQTVTLWDTAGRRALATVDARGPVRSMALSRNANRIAVAADGGAISLWTLPAGVKPR